MSNINPNNPPPLIGTVNYWEWVEENILFIKRRLNALAINGGGGGGTNIYNSDGTLAGNRTLNGDGKTLTFSTLDTFQTLDNNEVPMITVSNSSPVSAAGLGVFNSASGIVSLLYTIDSNAGFSASSEESQNTINLVAGTSELNLLEGTTNILNITLENSKYLSLDKDNSTYSIGDLDTAGSGTKVVVDDGTTTVSITGELSMLGSKIINVEDPDTAQGAVTVNWIDGQKGAINGIASLDGSGVVPNDQLPYTLLDYKGSWNANTNSPTLADGVGDTGDIYIVSVAGSQDLGSGTISFDVGNMVIYSGTVWEKIGAVVTATVTSVSSADNTWLTVANGTTTPVLTVVSAPKLATARTINNVSFDGTANILLNQSINAQTGTTYTFVISDNQKLVTATNASAQTYTVPPNASVAFPTGAQIDLIQLGAGAVTFAPGAGVTLRSRGGLLTVNGQYTGVTLKKIATNEWVIMGNLI